MSPFALRIAAGFGLALAQPLFAQAAPAPAPDGEIIVSTQRREAERAVETLARQVTGRIATDKPIVRFHRPLCLAVAGVNRQFVDSFAQRIYANAEAARVPVETGDCKANALVIFTGDTRKELEQARKKDRWVFGNLGPAALDAMLKSRDPAFAWRATQMLGTNGMPVQYDDRELPQNRTIEMAGRLSQPYKLDVSGAVVMIDRNAIDGMTAQQLADYATLRLLAPTGEIRERVPGAPETIMTLFLDPENAPPGLTEFDAAFLQGVYAIAGNVPAGAVYGEVSGRVMRGR
ncbi:MAG: hypothetical protein ACKO01_03820 [Erythrobacter sp.]